MSSPEEESDYEARMSFTEHLGELRTRIIRSGIVLIVSIAACFIFSEQLFNALRQPLEGLENNGMLQLMEELDFTKWWDAPEAPPIEGAPAEGMPPQGTPAVPNPDAPAIETTPSAAPNALRSVTWTTLSPLESLGVMIRIATYFGVLFSFPYLMYQACAFIFPGLLPRERKVAQLVIGACSMLAIIGVAIAYLLVFPLIVPYLLDYVPEGVEIQLRMSETVDFIIKGLLAFALAFQFPMVVLVLVFMGLLSPETLKSNRRLVVVAIAVISAILTPPDPVSMTVMMLPMLLLYEMSVWASYLVVRRKNKAAAKA
ncbi:MAG: twin-arginine translocase subunit TatC [Candidatus Hydrogenedentes bacterium]|nr:twin-arginine translocase subunit TatC [Candidatus Hydrogenedentota bacterium]